MPGAWSPDDNEPAPGGGLGMWLLFLVIGTILVAFAAGAVLVVLDLARTLTGLE